VHASAGRVAAPLFAIAGAAGGIAATRAITGSPPLVVNALIWAVIAALVAYMVFASEGPQQRPASIVQAAVADGVVTGMIAGALGAIVDILAANGAGSSNSKLTLGAFVLAFAGGLALGGVVGAPVGWVALLAGGRERFERAGRQGRKAKARPSAATGRPASGARKRRQRR
jgi:hypothetical protein